MLRNVEYWTTMLEDPIIFSQKGNVHIYFSFWNLSEYISATYCCIKHIGIYNGYIGFVSIKELRFRNNKQC